MEGIFMTEEQFVQACISGHADAYKKFYDLFAQRMMGVCLRYTTNADETQDILQDGFIKVFNKINTFKFIGSFEGWIRRIMVHTAIRNKYITYRSHEVNNLETISQPSTEEKITSKLSYNDLMKLVNELPHGYKLVFNLFAIEGYSHKEIAEMLEIQEATSRSQFLRARQFLREKLDKIKKNEFRI